MSRPTIAADDRKLRELLLYVSRRSMDDPNMGAVKLNKVLYRADFGAYRNVGRPVTGHPYFRLPEGPVPVYLVQVRDQLISEGAAHVALEDVGAEKPLERFVADRDPDLSVFSPDERAWIDSVIEEMLPMTGAQASAESHELIAWRVARHKEQIPYETALLGRATQADIDRGLELAREHGWA